MRFKREQGIFRQEAVERLSSPERLDQLMRIVGPMEWVPLVLLGSFLLVGMAWSIWGRIPIAVSGKGVLTNLQGVVPLQSAISGQIQTIHVQPGQCLVRDQLVATIEPTELRNQLQLARTKLAQLQQQANATVLLANQRLQAESQAITRSRNQLEQQLRQAQSLAPQLKAQAVNAIRGERQTVLERLVDAQRLVPALKRRWEDRKRLAAEGAIAQDILLQAERDYVQASQEISMLQAQLKQLDVKVTETEQRYQEQLSRIGDLQTQMQELQTRRKRTEQENLETRNTQSTPIQAAQREVVQLQQQIALNSQIRSPQAGCLLEVVVSQGRVISSGATLGTLQTHTSSQQLTAIAYFAVRDSKQIQPGMSIQVTPAGVQRERFGGIVGQVTAIAPFPATRSGIVALLGSEELANSILTVNSTAGDSSLIAVFTQLEAAPQTFSGYKWSSSSGPPLKLTAGTPVTTRVQVEERAPLTFVLPILREWTGIQ